MVLHLSISRRSNARKEPSAHGYPNPSNTTTTCVAGSANHPARGFSAKRSISRCVPSPERHCEWPQKRCTDVIAKRVSFMSWSWFQAWRGWICFLSNWQRYFSNISLSHSLSLSLWIFGNLQRKSQVWTRRTTFGLRGASRFPPDLRGWLNQQQPTTNGGSPKGGLPKSTP